MTAADVALIALPVSLALNGLFLRQVYSEMRASRDCLFGKNGVLSQLAVITARHEAEDREAPHGRRAYDNAAQQRARS